MLGLQALSQFAKLVQADQSDLSIFVSQSEEHEAVFDINEANRLVSQQFQLPNTNPLTVATNGSGCFLLQVSHDEDYGGHEVMMLLYPNR